MIEVVAINGSPSKEKGSTARLLKAFMDGMQEAGAISRLVYASEVRPHPCTGEMNCWYRTPGQCYQQDGMQEVYPILRKADILILATPVYIPLPGEMQNFINRLCPLFCPQLTFSNGRTKARARDGVKLRGLALVSTGAWWELANLEILEHIAKEISVKMDLKYYGAVQRPHAFILEKDPTKAEEIYQAARQAGRRLIVDGELPGDLLDQISKPLISEVDLRALWNALEQKSMSKKK